MVKLGGVNISSSVKFLLNLVQIRDRIALNIENHKEIPSRFYTTIHHVLEDQELLKVWKNSRGFVMKLNNVNKTLQKPSVSVMFCNNQMKSDNT